jgi:hypothetical protein
VNDVALELFSSFGSKEDVVTVAMLVKVVPGDVSESTCRIIVKSELDPAVNVAALHVIVPPEPIAGEAQMNRSGLLVSSIDTNVSPAGMTSVKVALDASSGPPLTTWMVNVTSVPAAALSGPDFETLRSLS